MEITAELVAEHGISTDEYQRIVTELGREPNYVELGIFSVMWSEHCSYKSSRVHLKGFPTTGPQVIEGPGENAGVVDIGEGLACVFKMESHNHPSFIEPYQGAATGVGGIMRDIFTMGARPVANLNSLFFGTFKNKKTPYLIDGVVAGIAGYGNCMGVPTVGGALYLNDSYAGNCLVNVMTAGICRSDKIFKGTASGLGNPIIYVGSKTGRDGIHGATMASDVFGEGGEERRPTVQVGDPFTEKLLLEACLELFKTDYIVGIQDMGAAGLTSSSVEMASRGGAGVEIDMDRIPRREEGMTSYELLLSESQERMLIVAKKGMEDKVKAIFTKWDLDCEVVGEVIEDETVRILEGGQIVADIPVTILTDSAPQYDRPAERPSWQDGLSYLDMDTIPLPDDYNEVFLRLLSSTNISSRHSIYSQFDYMVRSDTVVSPGSDAAVVRIKGTKRAIALTVDCNPLHCYLDPANGARAAVAEAARNLVCSGAEPLALTDCLNFGNPERPGIMWQFREAVAGIKEACIALNVPVIGGNVSLYNETRGEGIYPTPSIGMLGLIEDTDLITRQWFQGPGHLIVLLGRTRPGLGGTEYLSAIYGLERGSAPEVDLTEAESLHEACLEAIKTGIILSAHDCSEGGLAVTLAESSLNPAGTVGVEVDLGKVTGLRTDEALFAETHGRIVVSLKEDNLNVLQGIAAAHGVALQVIGRTVEDGFIVKGLIDTPLNTLKSAYRDSLKPLIEGEGV
ncbi:MAG: phosphoribosylformylglycinamidine synthase subunit PurL [Thermodesulfobacteriota bacterium]